MARKRAAIELPTVDDLFTSQTERDGAALEGIAEVRLALIDPFPEHPFQVRDDEEMERLAESIAENGVLVPLTVRASGAERYELVSGHRRKRAAEMAELESVPCLVRNMSDEEATIAMVDSNLQRETILPSERAFAYSMRLEAMKRQGRRTDLTWCASCAQVGRQEVAGHSGAGTGRQQGQGAALHTLDVPRPATASPCGRGPHEDAPAVEVSYLTEAEQEHLLDAMEAQACTPSHAQAIKMKRYSKDGSLTAALIRSIMEEEKPNQVEQVRIPKRSIARFFRPSATPAEVESRIVRALELLEQAERRRDGLGGA